MVRIFKFDTLTADVLKDVFEEWTEKLIIRMSETIDRWYSNDVSE